MKQKQTEISPTAKKWVKIVIQLLVTIASALIGDAADVTSSIINAF